MERSHVLTGGPPSLRRLLVLALSIAAAPVLAHDAASIDPEYLITTWRTDEGLPESTTTAMVQTADGYLWIGTFNGLARFDGLHWKVYDRSNTPELPSPEIVNLHLDRSDRLWISTPRGMASVKDGVWKVFSHGEGWVGNYARYFAEGRQGELYVSSFDGKLVRFDGKGFEEVPPPPGDPNRNGVFPHVDAAGTLWAFTPGFVGRHTAGRWESVIADEPGEAGVLAAGSGRDDGLWLITKARLRKYVGDKLVVDAEGPGEPFGTWKVYEDSAGTLWACAFNALYRFNRESGWYRVTTRTGLAYDNVRFAFEDREGSVWIGTNGGGLQRFRRRRFRSWGAEQGLPEPVLKSVAVDRHGRIVFGMHGQGVGRITDGRFEPVFVPSGKDPQMKQVHSYAVLPTRDDRLWIGTWRTGLLLHENGAARRYEAGPEGELRPGHDPLFVFSLLEDSRGRVWIGSNQGLSRHESGRFTTYRLPSATPLHSIRSLAEDRRTGAIWAGHHTEGLFLWRDGRLEPAAGADDLRRDPIAALHADADGTLWIGTVNRGLARLRHGRLARVTEREGLLARTIGAILDDGDGHLWIASNRGVLRVARPDVNEVLDGRRPRLDHLVFDQHDGLLTAACAFGSQPAAARDGEGRLWFATNKGLSMVDPRALRLNTIPPPVVIQDVWIDGEPVGQAPMLAAPYGARRPAVSIPAGARRIEIHYAGLTFSAPEKARFRYFLEGADESWIDVGNRRVAYFQDLKPGRYRFRVMAANNDGLWNETPAELELAVTPFFYQTRWFAWLGLATILGAAAAVHRWRVRRLEASERELAARVADALAQVKVLRGLLPICASCKKIRDDEGYWSQIETYIHARSHAEFSHAICPECLIRLYPEYARQLRDKG